MEIKTNAPNGGFIPSGMWDTAEKVKVIDKCNEALRILLENDLITHSQWCFLKNRLFGAQSNKDVRRVYRYAALLRDKHAVSKGKKLNAQSGTGVNH